MSQMKIEYRGEKSCTLTHLASGTTIVTDAPVDNHGRGQAFSPTDLLSASLGACMLTIMGIELEPLGVELRGSKCQIKKLMGTNPRQVKRLQVQLEMCAGIRQEMRGRVLEIAQTCPVQLSLNPVIEVVLDITYPD